jgi:hypothetical protein
LVAVPVHVWVDRGCGDRDLVDLECEDLADRDLADLDLVDREWLPAVSDAALVTRQVADALKAGRRVVVPMVIPVADRTDLAVAIVAVPKVVVPMAIAVTVGPIADQAATVPVMAVVTVDPTVPATVVETAAAVKKTKRSNTRSRQTNHSPGTRLSGSGRVSSSILERAPGFTSSSTFAAGSGARCPATFKRACRSARICCSRVRSRPIGIHPSVTLYLPAAPSCRTSVPSCRNVDPPAVALSGLSRSSSSLRTYTSIK